MGSRFDRIVLFTSLGAACAEVSKPPPEITFVNPTSVSALEATVISIHGKNFFTEVSDELDAAGEPAVDRTFRVRILPYELDGVEYVSVEELRATVPAGLPEMVYTVE